MADERVTLQGSLWPRTYKTHDSQYYTQDEAGLVYVKPEHVPQLLRRRDHGLSRYVAPTPDPAPAEEAVPEPTPVESAG